MANHPMLKRHANTIAQNPPPNGHNIMNLGPPGQSVPGGMGMAVGQRPPGDHNNNNGPSTPNGSPFTTPTHMKAALGSSS